MVIQWENIPQEIRAAPQWVMWNGVERDGKWTKPPFQPNGKAASHSDPGTWNRYEMVEVAHRRGGFDGVGFVLSDQDPFAGVDLDHCVNPETGEIAEWVRPVISRLNSYTEISPSGTGLRMFLKGTLPEGAPRGGRKQTGLGPDGKGAIELYCRLRYLTLTGRRLPESPAGVEERSSEFNDLYFSLFGQPEPKPALPVPTLSPVDLDDNDLLARMMGSLHGSEIIALWNGNTAAYAENDSSADLALCNHLAWWTGGDPGRMDRLFRASRLYRPKWDEQRGECTYGERTLDLALSGLTGSYEPGLPFHVDGNGSLNGHRKPVPSEDELEQARNLAAALPERLKADTGAVYDPEMLRALGMLRALDAAAYQRARTSLQAARVPIREVEKALPPIKQFLVPIEDEASRGLRAGDLVPGCPVPTLLIPSPYYLNESATGKEVPDDNGRFRKAVFAEAPVLIAGLTRDITQGTESLLLQWQTRFGWQSRVVDRSQAATGTGLVKLASFGLPVGEDNTRDLIPYLRRLLHANPELPCAKVSSKLGWQGIPGEVAFLCGSLLILPDGTVEMVSALDTEHPETWSEQRICFQGTGEGQEQVVAGFHSAGTFEDWLAAVAVLKGYPKALVMFYAGLAAPLLAVFGVPNFVLDISHDTTSGKTSILRATASHWGNPDERTPHSVVFTWNASRVGLERCSEVLDGLPLFVDDTKNSRNETQVANQVYEVTSGHGRIRGTIKGLAQTGHWRTIMFSTGEQPIASFTQAGGTRTRALQITGFPFGEQNPSLAALTAKLSAGVCRNYGHSGPRFLTWLQWNRDTWPQWKERYEGLTQELTDQAPNPEAGRLAAFAALIAITGEMAHRALPLPWQFEDPISSLWKGLAAEAADAAGSGRALEDILSWASSEEQRFIGRHLQTEFIERVPPAVYGRWDSREDWEYLAVYPTVLREVLTRLGYSPEGILRSWRERGWLRHREGKFVTDVPIGAGTSTRKMVVILRAAFDALNKG